MTCEQIALEHGLCTCDPIYTSRGMKAPDCPWHAYEVETAMEAYGRQEAVEFATYCEGLPQEINKTHTYEELYDLYLINKNKSDVKS